MAETERRGGTEPAGPTAAGRWGWIYALVVGALAVEIVALWLLGRAFP